MNRRHAILIFLAALALRVVYLAVAYTGPDSLMHPDSAMYVLLAEELQKSYVSGMPIPDEFTGMFSERAPGYLLFIAGVKIFISDNRLLIVVLQSILDAVTCVAIGGLAGFFHHRLVFPAGLLAAFNFNMIIHSTLIMSDALFMLPFVGGLIFAAAYIRGPSLSMAVGAAVLFSIALLVRPVLLYFPPILILSFAIVSWRHRLHVGKIFAHSVAIAMSFLVMIGPLLIKNKHDFGYFAYVSQTGTHALFWIYPQANEFANGVTREKSVADMNARLETYVDGLMFPDEPENPFLKSAQKKKVAADALWELGPYALAKAWVIGTGINIMTPAIIGSSLVRQMERPSFTETLGGNPIEKIWNYLSENRTFTLVLAPAILLTGFWRLVGLLSLLQLRPNHMRSSGEGRVRFLDPAQTNFLLLVGFYIFVVTGPVVGAKYRLPFEPALDIFLAAGLLWAVDFFGRR